MLCLWKKGFQKGHIIGLYQTKKTTQEVGETNEIGL